MRMRTWLDALRHRHRLQQWHVDHAWGRRGEDLAHRYLLEHGFTVVARNWRNWRNELEIDLVAWEGEALVFVEVKARRSDAFGAPDRAVTRAKEKHLLRAAREYAFRAQVPWDMVRFDIIAVLFGGEISIAHYRDAFGKRATS